MQLGTDENLAHEKNCSLASLERIDLSYVSMEIHIVNVTAENFSTTQKIQI